eukprot:SAG11_NODE_2224_length_3666_cov_2.269975_7_plen_92_part_00
MSGHGGLMVGAAHGGMLLPDGIFNMNGGLVTLKYICLLTVLFWSTCLALQPDATAYSAKLYLHSVRYLFCRCVSHMLCLSVESAPPSALGT